MPWQEKKTIFTFAIFGGLFEKVCQSIFVLFRLTSQNGPKNEVDFDAVFLGRTGILEKIWRLNYFLNGELHIILKLRNFEIGEHWSFLFNY